jgi:hypothetical protein
MHRIDSGSPIRASGAYLISAFAQSIFKSGLNIRPFEPLTPAKAYCGNCAADFIERTGSIIVAGICLRFP